MIELGEHRYGKSAIRLVKVDRRADGHRVRDVTVDVALEGAFDAAYTHGDNAAVVATDTMKNTVYALAADAFDGSIEALASTLAAHFLRVPDVTRATVDIVEHPWTRLVEGEEAFRRTGGWARTARVEHDRAARIVTAGLRELVVMKTAKSAFAGFPRDELTTLADTEDRIMATKVAATWRYDDPDVDHDREFEAVLATLLESFATHTSRSVQESIWIMAGAILDRHPAVGEVWMQLPNLHHWLVDLGRFGRANDNEIFVATTEPHGLIEATVRRASGGGVAAALDARRVMTTAD